LTARRPALSVVDQYRAERTRAKNASTHACDGLGQPAITDHLLGERSVGMAEVGELLVAA
jgi:hypothetical protein